MRSPKPGWERRIGKEGGVARSAEYRNFSISPAWHMVSIIDSIIFSKDVKMAVVLGVVEIDSIISFLYSPHTCKISDSVAYFMATILFIIPVNWACVLESMGNSHGSRLDWLPSADFFIDTAVFWRDRSRVVKSLRGMCS